MSPDRKGAVPLFFESSPDKGVRPLFATAVLIAAIVATALGADNEDSRTDRSPALGGLRRSFVTSGASTADWLQWGGPGRNFMPDATGLASSWPSGGPKRLWTRALGEGHSAILVEGGRIYTMYRPLGIMSLVHRSQEEVVAALDAATGKRRGNSNMRRRPTAWISRRAPAPTQRRSSPATGCTR